MRKVLMNKFKVVIWMLVCMGLCLERLGAQSNQEIETVAAVPDWVYYPPEDDGIHFFSVGSARLSSPGASIKYAEFNALYYLAYRLLFPFAFETSGGFVLALGESDELWAFEDVLLEVVFELAELAKAERRVQVADGKVCVLMSIQKEDTENTIETILHGDTWANIRQEQLDEKKSKFLFNEIIAEMDRALEKRLEK
jgi:hypothetical protein